MQGATARCSGPSGQTDGQTDISLHAGQLTQVRAKYFPTQEQDFSDSQAFDCHAI